MTVYVDNMKAPFHGTLMSHLFADTAKELFIMVDRIGVQRKWYRKSSSLPHFYICQTKRALALAAGAIELNIGKEWQKIYRRLKAEFSNDEMRREFLEFMNSKGVIE